MYKLRKPILFLLLLFLFNACNSEVKESKDNNEPLTFNNPILRGFYPDPGICRVGNDYYLVTSTFAYFPGIPIFHSTDLVNWEQIGSAIDRTDQMDFTGHGVSRGLFAPTITHYDGWFYVVGTLIDTGGNFVVRSRNPEGPYSDPFYMPLVNGIDPSLFIEENGDAYILYNSIPPNNKSLYSGHRTIRMRPYDLENMKTNGEEIILVNGGVDITKEPVWIEAPHIYKINDLYYLMCAEGGTAYNHSEVVFRSENIEGPYIPYEGNPILTQRHLDPSRENPITTTGHADLVQTPSGEWWAVFLGCRPYEGNHYNIGRETFLTPVKWENGWPIINPDFEEVQYNYPVPTMTPEITKIKDVSEDEDNFKGPWDKRWMFLRTPFEKWYEYDQESGTITMDLRSEVIDDKNNPALLLKRQNFLIGQATTQLKFVSQSNSEMAGFVIMQNDNQYYFINKGIKSIQLLKKEETGLELLNEVPYDNETVHLRISTDGPTYTFEFSEDGDNFETIASDVDGKFLSTETAGGFVGSMLGLYATSNGVASDNKATFYYLNRKIEDKTYQIQ